MIVGIRTHAVDTSLELEKQYQQSLEEMRGLSNTQDRSSSKRFTPYWAAQVLGGETAAKELASKYGFVYLGEVSFFPIMPFSSNH